MLTPKELGFNMASIGKMLLIDVAPYYEYQDNVPTNHLLGYAYTVALPAKNFKRLKVKIAGKQLMEKPENYTEVQFTGLEVIAYASGKHVRLSAKALDIALVGKEA